MTLPTIHLNGTHPRDLLEDQMAVTNALRAAIESMQRACPNGRDYYPQSSTAFQAAMDEHRDRILKLTNVLREVEAIMDHLASNQR
jgi:hypothetical protein